MKLLLALISKYLSKNQWIYTEKKSFLLYILYYRTYGALERLLLPLTLSSLSCHGNLKFITHTAKTHYTNQKKITTKKLLSFKANLLNNWIIRISVVSAAFHVKTAYTKKNGERNWSCMLCLKLLQQSIVIFFCVQFSYFLLLFFRWLNHCLLVISF